MRLKSFAILAGCLASAASAKEECRDGVAMGSPQTNVPIASNEFRRTGEALACQIDAHVVDLLKANKTPPLSKTCYVIGSVGIDMTRAEIEKKLGKPVREMPHNELTARLYLIVKSKQPIGYYVVYYKGAIAEGVQTTLAAEGSGPLPVAFSSIHAGDPVQRALDILGTPKESCKGEGTVGERWEYPLYGISLEISNGVVFSIKLGRPLGEVAKG